MADLRVLAIQLRTLMFVAVTYESILLIQAKAINRYHLNI